MREIWLAIPGSEVRRSHMCVVLVAGSSQLAKKEWGPLSSNLGTILPTIWMNLESNYSPEPPDKNPVW